MTEENPREKLFVMGARVRVNETFPYGDHGREGTITNLPLSWHRHSLTGWVGVTFDDNTIPRYVKWHRDYFDLINEVEQLRAHGQ